MCRCALPVARSAGGVEITNELEARNLRRWPRYHVVLLAAINRLREHSGIDSETVRAHHHEDQMTEQAATFTCGPPITILRKNANEAWQCAACPRTFGEPWNANAGWGGDMTEEGRRAKEHFIVAHGTEADARAVMEGRL